MNDWLSKLINIGSEFCEEDAITANITTERDKVLNSVDNAKQLCKRVIYDTLTSIKDWECKFNTELDNMAKKQLQLLPNQYNIDKNKELLLQHINEAKTIISIGEASPEIVNHYLNTIEPIVNEMKQIKVPTLSQVSFAPSYDHIMLLKSDLERHKLGYISTTSLKPRDLYLVKPLKLYAGTEVTFIIRANSMINNEELLELISWDLKGGDDELTSFIRVNSTDVGIELVFVPSENLCSYTLCVKMCHQHIQGSPVSFIPRNFTLKRIVNTVTDGLPSLNDVSFSSINLDLTALNLKEQSAIGQCSTSKRPRTESDIDCQTICSDAQSDCIDLIDTYSLISNRSMTPLQALDSYDIKKELPFLSPIKDRLERDNNIIMADRCSTPLSEFNTNDTIFAPTTEYRPVMAEVRCDVNENVVSSICDVELMNNKRGRHIQIRECLDDVGGLKGICTSIMSIAKDSMNHPIGVTELINKDVLVTDTFGDRLALFSASGEFIRTFNSQPQLKQPSAVVVMNNGNFAVKGRNIIVIFSKVYIQLYLFDLAKITNRSYGLIMDKNENFMTIETMNSMSLLTISSLTGKLLSKLAIHKAVPHNLVRYSKPYFIAQQNDESIVIVDLGTHMFYIINIKTGKLIRRVGNKGSKVGEFHDPSGVTCDFNGFIIIGDSLNHRIQIFSPNGDFYRVLDIDREVRRPSGLCLTSSGDLLVVNYWEGSVARYKLIVNG